MTDYVGTTESGTDLARQSDTSLPAGSLLPYAGATAPSGYLTCDGSQQPIATYTNLYNALTATGTVFPYGANTNGSGGAGSTHFRLPDLKGRVVVGVDAGQTEFDTRGESGGAKTVTLATSEIPSHSHTAGTLSADSNGAHAHTLTGGGHTHTYDRATISVSTGSNFNRTGSSNGVTAVTLTNTSTNSGSTTPTAKVEADGTHTHSVSGSTNTAGSGGSHNNLPPYLALSYIIKT